MTALCPPDRVDRAQQAAGRAGLDALLLTPGADLRYLTGYAAMPLERLTCLVVPAAGRPFLVVPLLERPAALASPAADLGIEIIGWAETDDPYRLLADLLRRQLGRATDRVGMADRMWLEQALRLRDALGAGVGLAGEVMRGLRVRKSPAEIEALARAAAAIDRVHARIGEWLRPGRTEAQVGRDIAEAIVGEGHVRADFVIVGSGPNGASPHHELSDRVIAPGDPVVVDIGGTTAEGYCSDSTRTYVVGGTPDPELVRCYAVLAQAQEAACDAIAPGVSCQHIDAVARQVITDAGYGAQFVHRTGHGIGLESHEDPYLVAGNEDPLEPGMTFSVEPGIYLAGRHGARIEDICVCTEDGGRRLNLTSRELSVLG
ncbi:MAG: aminopeptidase P family protein [Actinobacteria bacterium]|nr:aminopeptidase P family protein [Actinomycetota bacterium]